MKTLFAILQAYKIADTDNMKRLEIAFPFWFIDKIKI